MNRDVNDVTKGAMVTHGKTKTGYVVLENPDALIIDTVGAYRRRLQGKFGIIPNVLRRSFDRGRRGGGNVSRALGRQ